eukprot:scaffold32130_cov66-Phaeocystis_antarctica.AAC.5
MSACIETLSASIEAFWLRCRPIMACNDAMSTCIETLSACSDAFSASIEANFACSEAISACSAWGGGGGSKGSGGEGSGGEGGGAEGGGGGEANMQMHCRDEEHAPELLTL